jgi:hypothetical protein
LIHGLSIPAIVWKDVAPTLAARGFRVLLYGIFTQPLILMSIYLYMIKISTGEVTLTRRKLPMIQIYIPHNLPILCNILDGKKQILSVSQWYVRISSLAQNLSSRFQGGAIAAAFTSHFPHLVDEGVALIASAGLVEVRISVVSLPDYDPHVTT